jgi:hypothetical protein
MKRSTWNFARLALVAMTGPAMHGVAPAQDAGTLYSTLDLLSNGKAAYDRDAWREASRFLFAYVQRNPVELQTDAEFRKRVVDALNESMGKSGAGTDSKSDDPNAPRPPQSPKVNLRLPSSATAGSGRCDIYATVAVAQQNANERQACHLGGNRWVANYAFHYKWCIASSSTAAKQETAARQQMLDSCKP